MSKTVEAGETATVTTLEDAPSEAGANNVIDLTDLLAKRLAKRKPVSSATVGSRDTETTPKKTAAKTSTRRRA